MKFYSLLQELFVTGINYKKADVTIRGAFSVSTDQAEAFYTLAKENGCATLVLLSTCNRTEIYGTGDASKAVAVLCKVLGRQPEEWVSHQFLKTRHEAVHHAFEVATGLDSQILGDNEILGQFRESFKRAKQLGALDGFMERMGNACIQAAREVRSRTELSDGTVSASFAAIKLLKNRKLPAGTPVLLIGLGSFGTGLARNIRTYLPHVDLVLCNRTDEKAQALSDEIRARSIPFSEVVRSAADFRVVIATISGRPGAPLIPYSTWDAGSPVLALDLSVPTAMEKPDVNIPGQEFLSIDAVSEVIRSTLSYRESFLPQARKMLIKHLEEFLHWSRVYEQRDLIRDVKKELLASSHRCPFWHQMEHSEHEKLIQDVVADYVKFLKGAPDQDRSRAGWIQSWMDLVHRQLITLEEAPAEGQGHAHQVSAV